MKQAKRPGLRILFWLAYYGGLVALIVKLFGGKCTVE